MNGGKFVKDLDYLVLTLPLTKATYHVINEDILREMKPKSCLVNVGRGALVDEGDLLSVMESGHFKQLSLMYLRQNRYQRIMSSSPRRMFM